MADGTLLLATAALPASAAAVTVTRAPFGQTPDGKMVEAVTLANDRGMQAGSSPLGRRFSR